MAETSLITESAGVQSKKGSSLLYLHLTHTLTYLPQYGQP